MGNNFADPIDKAEHIATLMKERHIKNIRSKGREALPNQYCHFCKEPVAGEKIFCDMYCANDFERAKTQR